MESFRLNIQDADTSVGSTPPGLLSDKSERIALIHETKFACRIFLRGGVDINTTLQQVTVKIGYERADITRGVT